LSRVGVVVPRGEIRYLQIPTADVDASAGFYERALGWTIRTRGDGSTAFDDATSEVSGEWVLDRQPAGDAGVLVYVRVDDVEAILQKIAEAGGEIVVPPTPQGERMAYATFRDPAGNVLGIFQEGS
jgi:predicted enzyme related to lactoylglutathione lyase